MVQTVKVGQHLAAPLKQRSSTANIVEIVGPAGVGKSTLTNALCQSCPGASAGIDPRRLVTTAAFVAEMTRLVPAYFSGCLGSRWLSRNEMRCVYLLEAWRNRANDASSPTPILTVMDHGPIFRLTYLRVFGLSLTKTRRFRRWWDQMLADWSQSLQGIVCLEASNEELIGRVRRRQGRSNRFQARSDSGAQKFLEDYRRGYDEVLSSIARQGGPEVMTFNTQHQSPDEIATAVLAKLGLAKSSPTTVENQAHILNQGR